MRVVLEQVGGEELDRIRRPVRGQRSEVRRNVSDATCQVRRTAVSTPGATVRIRAGRLGAPRLRACMRTRVHGMGVLRTWGEDQG